MITWKAIGGCVLVSILWGCTNPYIKYAQQASATAYNQESIQSNKENVKNSLWDTLTNLKRSMMNIKVMAPFALNQLGSAVFFLLLSTEPVSVVSPVCNSLTFLFTAITSYTVFKESVKYPWMLVVGIFFILCGTALCM
jgi:multidrug transporter EmrE-like cation transporter